MGGNDTEVNLTIKAKDEASSAIAKLTTAVDSLNKTMLAGAKASEAVTESQKKTAASHDNMAASVFKGVAAWDLLKKSIGAAKDFLEDSTKAYLDAQQKIDLTRAVVESMGQSFDAVKPKLDAFGASMVRMGTDDEDANLAAAKLAKAVGGDLTKGMELAKLAADLTSSGYNDFAGNVDNLSKVLSGKGERALMDYRINLDAAATTADQLNAIQAKVTQTTEQYADTIPGKLKVLQGAFDNLKEEIGGAFVASLNSATGGTDDLNGVLDNMAAAAHVAAIGVFEATSFVIALYKSMDVLGKGINIAITGFIALKKVVSGDLDGAMAEATSAIDEYKKSADSFNKTLTDMAHPTDALAAAEKKLEDQHKATGAAAKTGSYDVVNANTSAGASVDKLTSKYTDLASALTNVRQTAVDELKKITDAHTDATKASVAKINDLKASLRDLSDEYDRNSQRAAASYASQAKQDAASVGDAIVAQQQKIADLKKQAGSETDPQKKINLLAQLAVEQKAYDDQAEFIKSKSVEVAEAKRVAGLTDFERAIEDYKTKRAQADQEYADNRADALREYSAKTAELTKQLKQEKDKMATENAQYATAQAGITASLAAAEALRLDTTKKTSDEILKLVDAQILRYNKLADAISRASQGKAVQITSASIPIREHGGIVPGPVGVAVPIIAHGQERVVPASQTTSSSGGGSYSIIIQNPQIRSDQDLAAMRQMIENALRDVSRVHKLTTI